MIALQLARGAASERRLWARSPATDACHARTATLRHEWGRATETRSAIA